ncbi:hypothetical protein [Oceanirhabdus sp. W0125-5]|uniref:hypothetical protein n=1 Tax=Oceanirhabdus sp. W0125-5 TaxID=2999116 RepID=UPI0022F2E556|nr:hypothetical protein [Oceanirhabdus sp. W0125-5]WBW95828.1 hypothetical protein OW730_19365 [Oceanirhabdus sp. W0125-5]
MGKKRGIIGIIIIIMIIISTIGIKYMSILNNYKEVRESGNNYNYSVTQHPFYNNYESLEFLTDGKKDLKLKLWCEGLTGNVVVKVFSEYGDICYENKFKKINEEVLVPLKEGKYKMEISIKSFTGAVALGYENILMLKNLPEENYSIIPSNPSKGFHWEYILYIPDNVTTNKLLVVPNNTGTTSDNMDFHRESAKRLILYKSKLAEELGVPLLVPIFQRPSSVESMYTHELDRDTIFSELSDLRRLDLQLIEMINDSKEILSEKGIEMDKKILMSGFSASGSFTDRFTFLHPELVEGAFFGGAGNIIPYKELNGENLPYPIGIYDYKKITGKEFDLNLFSKVHRYMFKGSLDEGGWVKTNINGEAVTYTGKEYYLKFKVPEILKRSKNHDAPIYVDGDLTEMDEDDIFFKAYDQKILQERFLIIKSIFEECNLNNNEFVIYENVGHEITNEIEEDELKFFKGILDILN